MFALCLGVMLVWSDRPIGAQSPAPNRAILVELKFVGGDGALRVELGTVKRVERRVPRQLGTPQLSPIFFEVKGVVAGAADPVVQYAGILTDPRVLHMQGLDPETGKIKATQYLLEEASVVILIPDLQGTRLSVWRRTGSEETNEREALLQETSL